jgi:hypothetical protein
MKRLAQGAITTGGGTLLYTTPTGMRTEVLDLCIANTTTGPLTAAIHLVPTGASATTANMLFPTVTVPANTLIQWTGSQVLNAGDFVQGIGSAAGITVNITGNEGRAGT